MSTDAKTARTFPFLFRIGLIMVLLSAVPLLKMFFQISDVVKKDAATHPPMRETLFGDMPLDQWPSHGEMSDAFPWKTFTTARQHFQTGKQDEAIKLWREILDHSDLESRHHLQAWHFLEQAGYHPPQEKAKQLLGVVVEVAMPKGLDLLAAYSDHSARYYNYSGSGVVWEHPDASLNELIDQLLEASVKTVVQIDPWEKARPSPPPQGSVRLSFLTPAGLHFKQGTMDAISRDQLDGQVFLSAVALMKSLIENHGKQ